MKKTGLRKGRRRWKDVRKPTPEKERGALADDSVVKRGHVPALNPMFWLVAVLIAGVVLRVYKAGYTGMIFDEIWTVEDFCNNFHAAVTQFHTNNHIINSIFIVLTEKVFGGYEHYPRIPSVLFGIVFCVALMDIVHQTLRSGALKVVVFLLILLNWFVFDLTYLARGYAISLGVTFTGMALLLRWFSGGGQGGKVDWKVVFGLVVMNFLAIGSMLSSLGFVLTLNAAFLVFTTIGCWKQKEGGRKGAVGAVFVLAAGSAISLYLIFQNVLSRILSRSKTFESEPFFEYMKKILYQPLIYIDYSRIQFNMSVFKWGVVVLVVCIVIYFISLFSRLARTKTINRSAFSEAATLVLFFTAGVFLLMFVQNVIFGISLGMPRNGVFLLPLVLLSSGIVMERAVNALSGVRLFQHCLYFVCVGILGVLFYLNLPSLRSVDMRITDWSEQSAVGPLARSLQQIDPEKNWRIRLVRQTRPCRRSIKYYRKFGYLLKYVPDSAKNFDLMIVPAAPVKQPVTFFEKKRFMDHHCIIVANPASFTGKGVFTQVSSGSLEGRYEIPGR